MVPPAMLCDVRAALPGRCRRSASRLGSRRSRRQYLGAYETGREKRHASSLQRKRRQLESSLKCIFLVCRHCYAYLRIRTRQVSGNNTTIVINIHQRHQHPSTSSTPYGLVRSVSVFNSTIRYCSYECENYHHQSRHRRSVLFICYANTSVRNECIILIPAALVVYTVLVRLYTKNTTMVIAMLQYLESSTLKKPEYLERLGDW